MSRNFVEKGLLAVAFSIGIVTQALAAAAPGSNPTSAETPAAPAASTTSTTTTTTPSATTTSTTTVNTTQAPATTSATAAPASTSTTAATAAPAASSATTAPATTSNSSSSSAATTDSAQTSSTTSSTTTDAAKPTTTTTTTTTTSDSKKEEPVNYGLSYQNAIHSESVVIAEYLGYQKNPDVRWNQPIQADYKIVKFLKGPPLNRHLPIKYEFHDHSNPPTPKDWKFNPKDMPAVGSQWLIFIEHSVPHNGQFETYQGTYGRQPATEDNLNKVYQLLTNQGEAGY